MKQTVNTNTFEQSKTIATKTIKNNKNITTSHSLAPSSRVAHPPPPSAQADNVSPTEWLLHRATKLASPEDLAGTSMLGNSMVLIRKILTEAEVLLLNGTFNPVFITGTRYYERSSTPRLHTRETRMRSDVYAPSMRVLANTLTVCSPSSNVSPSATMEGMISALSKATVPRAKRSLYPSRRRTPTCCVLRF